jgi:hypothetical protein
MSTTKELASQLKFDLTRLQERIDSAGGRMAIEAGELTGVIETATLLEAGVSKPAEAPVPLRFSPTVESK